MGNPRERQRWGAQTGRPGAVGPMGTRLIGAGFTPSRPHTTQSAFSGQTLSRMFSFGVPGGGRFRRGGGEEVPALVPGVLIGGTDEAEASPISGTRAVGWSGRPGVG